MEKALSFILLLCGILSQGICCSSKEDNVASETLSNLHIREKRVTQGDTSNRNEAPFLVTILFRGNHYAPASLLTADTAITSAHVFKNQDQREFSFESRMIGGERNHSIVRLIFLDPHYNVTHSTYKNLALVKFGPPIYFPNSVNRPIRIHSGSIVDQHLEFRILNWGKPFMQRGRMVSLHHRSIIVHLISIEYCQQMYPGLIGPGNICTNSMNFGQHGTPMDSGAPLLVDENLLGIMVFHGVGRAQVPDVFMNLMDEDIRRWIHQYVPALHLF